VEKYNLILQQQLSYHRIPEKIATLQLAISKNQWNQLCQTQYERIDALITQSMHHAERQSSKKYTGKLMVPCIDTIHPKRAVLEIVVENNKGSTRLVADTTPNTTGSRHYQSTNPSHYRDY
jgi:hypothetical protein